MNAKQEKIILLAADFVAINLAWLVYYFVRVRSGIVGMSMNVELWLPMVAIYLFWLLLFFAVGLYRSWYAESRFDEITRAFKIISFGCLSLFFAVFADDVGKNVNIQSRLLIAIYWAIMLGSVSVERLVLRSVQRRMLIAGVGARKTIIVGSEAKSQELYDELLKYPALGYKTIGFVSLERTRATPHCTLPVLGDLSALHAVVERHDVREVLIALDSSDHDRLLDIVSKCNGHKVGLKIIPDLYDIISGQARTNQIYGFPLIEISPQLLTPWEATAKRTIDVMVSAAVLVLGLPFWLLIAAMIKVESHGPVLYKQERVGKDGKLFSIIKFRSMYRDAEKEGPQWAEKKDPRVTRFGKILRKLHLDEIPQLLNVLVGEMSLIGPRPERPVFVEQLSKEIPMYLRRLKVRPGISGWAQVKHKYDENIEDVRKKVQYDLFYIENMSLRMDFKILLSTVAHVLLGRGHT